MHGLTIFSKGITVSDTATATTAAAKKAAEKAATILSDVAPVVEESIEIVAQVPAKVVFNQRVVVAGVSVVSLVVGATTLWGIQKLRAARAAKKTVEAAENLTAVADPTV